MPDRLFVGVLGNRNSGKTTTWNRLFGRRVKTGKHERDLKLRPGECVKAFLISGSNEERGLYAGDILRDQECRIVLCSMQYTDDVHDTLDYAIEHDFYMYIHWLNPGFKDKENSKIWDSLGLTNKILANRSVFAIRNGQIDPRRRVQEMRECIYGWALYRGLIRNC